MKQREIINESDFTKKELDQIVNPMTKEREEKIHKKSMAYDDKEDNEDFEFKFLDEEE
ncbi:unnamed protein product [marine sediment metagenome]|uniref:Uncharacterized protein n=1 Tax=marine sediment metagenome TaxID=412755 RepID=X1JPT0_9ZZZZ